MTGTDIEEQNAATANLLVFGGYLPFAVLTLFFLFPEIAPLTRSGSLIMLIGYGAVILSFLGGIRWGLATARNDEASARELLTSVVPSLIAWMCLTLPSAPSLVLLAVTFVWHYFWDRRHAEKHRLPGWFLPLRRRITIAVVPTLLIAAVAVLL
ncbi:DUF3429 domain-containing protein [Notoacmeibacter sp. MSK16QG-6]|uniref:DUF3429 domain-containing protein n=1 Tax=Notoacmeibacter sp. MSK16QG-6 TaxID=2957982 RepID=UPI0020A0E024|nr:DUF3429 domain-containing protein [Notoacmeibacter sp. MSK16QG-6]MCP1198634.1 DUF3429 domain-containing protein [Notoacmeibacter sp. MSK16QG-6]